MSWSVIIPETATNYVKNPVAMGTADYIAVGATVAPTVSSSGTPSYLGYKYYLVTGSADNNGVNLALATLGSAVHYVTVRTYGTVSGWDWSLDNSNFNAPTCIGTEGSWYTYGYQFSASQANGGTALYIYKNGAASFTWVIGHVQVEQNTYATTPITGDIRGFCSDGYYWNGSSHASSSTRAAKERSGGKVVNLESTYGLIVRYGLGGGMPPIQHHTQTMALLPGALYQGHKVLPRTIDLVTATNATSMATSASVKKSFIDAIKIDRVSPEQPVVFETNDMNASKPVRVNAYYDSGLEYQKTQSIDEPVARFIAYDPFIYETHTQGIGLTTSQNVTDADYAMRKVNGVWYNISTSFNQAVRAIEKAADGNIVIAGQFTNVGGTAGDFIVKYDPYLGTITPLGIGVNGLVFTLSTSPGGDIFAGGAFGTAGGSANTSKIAYFDVSEGVWKSLSATLPSDSVYNIKFDQYNNAIVGGGFTNLGDANGDYIVKYSGAGWVSLGTAGANGDVNAITIAKNNDYIAAGAFSLMGSVANTAYIARYGTNDATPAWYAMGSGLNGTAWCLATMDNGNIVVGGAFGTADGVACANIAMWNGKTFEPLGSGLSGTCFRLATYNNYVIASGNFASAGSITVSDRIAVWNGYTWSHLDVNLPGTPTVYSILYDNGNLYLGYDTAGTAITSYPNTVVNPGSSESYPVIKIRRTDDTLDNTIVTNANLEWIANETTGDTLRCNYAIRPGETLTLDFTPGNRSIKSSYSGDVWRAVLRASDLSSFRLLPGTNNISVFVNPTGSPTVEAWMEWPITHWAAESSAA